MMNNLGSITIMAFCLTGLLSLSIYVCSSRYEGLTLATD